MKTIQQSDIKIRRTWGNFSPVTRIHDGRGKKGKGYNRAKQNSWKKNLD